MKQLSAAVVENRPIARDLYKMTLEWEPRAGMPRPGQFLTVRVSSATVPLLRRPFAFAGYAGDPSRVSVIYQKRGQGTEILAGVGVGDSLDIVGPLGNTFELPATNEKCVVVAGGIGFGPMLYLASTLASGGNEVLFVFGCRSKEFVPDTETFKGFDPVICTDDGSQGFGGTVVDYLRTLGTEIGSFRLFACGPTPMLRACHEFALEQEVSCEVAMEQVMACGVGACMGCVIRVRSGSGFARVCTEGPVFDSREIIWT